MDKGFYLYCIIRGKSNSKFSTEGIDGGKIFAIPYQDLETVVSKVSLEKFGSEEIQRKAQEDLGWIKKKALLHEKVIEEAMGLQSPHLLLGEDSFKNKNLKAVIPMKFGTIFKTKERLTQTLRKYHSKFKKSLKDLKEKQEWAVKVYLNRKILEKEVKKESPVVQEKEKEIAQLPEGMAYFLQKQIDDAVSQETAKALRKHIQGFFENLKRYANAATKGKILEKELTGKSLAMVLNAVFLIPEKDLKGFLREINNLNKEFKSKGFTFEYSGPWPPYSFV